LFPVQFDHLRRLTDDTGLLEHCHGKLPRRKEGYSTDDNARALWLCAAWIPYAKAAGDVQTSQLLQALADRYASFLLWVQDEDGWFHNNVGYNRVFEPEAPSDDCQGRSLWALAKAVLNVPDPEWTLPLQCAFYRGVQAASRLQFARGLAHTLSAVSAMWLGVAQGARVEPWFADWALRTLPGQARRLAAALYEQYEACARDDWQWFEPTLTYANGVLPWALWHAWEALQDERARCIASTSLQFLIAKMTAPQGHIRPIGNQGWATPASVSQWDQQPLEVMKLALACAKAIELGEEEDGLYRRTLERCVQWYHGENDLQVVMADRTDGSCCDGLMQTGANRNRGAESTLSYLLTETFRYVVTAEHQPQLVRVALE
jgi:hypothetical protein